MQNEQLYINDVGALECIFSERLQILLTLDVNFNGYYFYYY